MGNIFIFNIYQISCKGVNLFTGHPVRLGDTRKGWSPTIPNIRIVTHQKEVYYIPTIPIMVTHQPKDGNPPAGSVLYVI